MTTEQIIPAPKFARLFYATAIIAFGIQQLMFGILIGARPRPWPEGMDGQNILAYITGLIFIAAGALVFRGSQSRIPLVIVSVYILLAAVVPNLIYVISELHYGGVLTSLGKSLTFGSGALLVADSFNGTDNNPTVKKIISLSWICRYCTGFFLLLGGVQHFVFAGFVKFLIPPFIPGALFWTYFAGVALIAAGIGLLTGIKAKLAATLAGWMVFAWVFSLHIPLAIMNPSQNEWTAVFEALGVSGILFLIANRAGR